MTREEEIVKERLKKIEDLKKKGINPYPYSFNRSHYAHQLQIKYKDLKNEQESKDSVRVCGRVISLRDMGGINFISLIDGSGKIQLVFKDKTAKDIKSFDVGDFIGCEGTIFRTKRGELSVLVTNSEILSKSIKPLPEKFHGLQDIEERYRKRYLDLISNEKSREVFFMRTKIIQAIREFLDSKDYLEVETPILQPVYGGAAAKPFKTFINELKQEVYLRVADELYLKRLIIGGFEKVYEISKDFRNESIDMQHNPEFTMLEFYEAYIDRDQVADLFEKMMAFVAKKVLGTTSFEYQGNKIDFGKWRKVSMHDLVNEKFGIDMEKMSDAKLLELAMKHAPDKVSKNSPRGELINELFETFAKKIIEPTIVMDYPKETCPLCKVHRKNEKLIERFEPTCCGMELGNAYSELNDPILQKKLLLEQVKERRNEAEPWTSELDEDFIEAMEHGMPPTGGMGIGIDRIVMLLTNSPSIRDVILFPFMKTEKKKDEEQKVAGYYAEMLLKDAKETKEKVKKKDSEKVLISEEAKKLGLKTSYAIISGVRVKKSDSELEKLKKEIKAKRTERLEAMKKAYRSFDIDPAKRTPSAEALIERLEQGKSIYSINTLVDAYNFSSVRENLPMASYDLSKIAWPIVLREAKEGEKITFIGGEVKKTKKGEMVYSDEEKIVCLDFNYRDCDETKITEKTKEVIVFVDGCKGIEDKDILRALDNTCDLIIKFNGGKVIEKKLVK